MNQLEYFLASSEGSRADVMRYLQRLRDLDEWVEHHLAALRSLAADRVATLALSAAELKRGQRGGRAGYGASRGRGAGRGRGASAVAPPAPERGEKASDDAAVYAAALQREFEWHESCVRQYCLEREALAAELAERCAEIRLSMASRLANFASVADVPATEFSN